MKNVFQRRYPIEDLNKIALCDMTSGELISYVTTLYPHDVEGALRIMYENLEIGYILYNETMLILGGSIK